VVNNKNFKNAANKNVIHLMNLEKLTFIGCFLGYYPKEDADSRYLAESLNAAIQYNLKE